MKSSIGTDGRRYFAFTCSYTFNGQKWSTEVHATTLEEAEMKLRAMATGTVDGILSDIIPADGLCPTCKQPWGGTCDI